jgi:hypothetical protein
MARLYLRTLRVSWLVLILALVISAVLRVVGGRLETVATWLPLAVITAFLSWHAVGLTRVAPGIWNRPLVRIGVQKTAVWFVALNGLLAAVTVLFLLIARLMPVPFARELLLWLSGLPLMIGVAIHPRWGLGGFVVDVLVLLATGRPITALRFALTSGVLGAVSGMAVARGVSRFALWLWCAAALVPSLALGTTLIGLHPLAVVIDIRQPTGLIMIVAVAVVMGFAWALTAMGLFPPLARTLRIAILAASMRRTV